MERPDKKDFSDVYEYVVKLNKYIDTLESQFTEAEKKLEKARNALKELIDIGDSRDWPNIEDTKYVQSSLYHDMRDIAKEALQEIGE